MGQERLPKTSLVTGATGGVGRALTRRLISIGSNLWLLGRRESELLTLKDSAGKQVSVTVLPGDLRSGDYLAHVARQVCSKTSKIDLLVHCGGQYSTSDWSSFADSEYSDVFSVNVQAREKLSRDLLAPLVSSQGMIVYLNSTVGLRDNGTPGIYAASMHAMRLAANVLRREVNPLGVRVLSVFLGRTATPMQERIHRFEGKPYNPANLIQAGTVADLILNAFTLPRDAEITDISITPMASPKQSNEG